MESASFIDSCERGEFSGTFQEYLYYQMRVVCT